jgi:xylulokinase
VQGLVKDPVVVPYSLDYDAGRVTCNPERYYRTALEALSQAAQAVRTSGRRIEAIGISSQAQTYIPLDRKGAPLGNAVVWTDNRAAQEAEELTQAIPEVTALCGFKRFSGQQFLPKVLHFLREGQVTRDLVSQFLLLHEYIAYRLTGMAYGEETSQGMGGFYDITARAWSPAALETAGITSDQLAAVAPSAGQSPPLLPNLCQELGLNAVPVYVCGNDQTCAAAGVDLEEDGVLCNFGTAMVAYTRNKERPESVSETQIAGIDPLTSRYFLLGFEPECGNVLEWMADLLYPGQEIEVMQQKATSAAIDSTALPRISFKGGGRLEIQDLTVGSRPEILARSLLEYYADRFEILLQEVQGTEGRIGRLIASGGLARSQTWLDFLEQRLSLSFVRAQSEHPGLIGIARIIAQNAIRNGKCPGG